MTKKPRMTNNHKPGPNSGFYRSGFFRHLAFGIRNLSARAGPLSGFVMQKPLVWICLGLLVAGTILLVRFRRSSDPFERLMARGAGYLEKGDATNAVATYSQAVKLVPESLNARLNLGN